MALNGKLSAVGCVQVCTKAERKFTYKFYMKYCLQNNYKNGDCTKLWWNVRI